MGQNIEGLWRYVQGVQLATPDTAKRRDTFHEFIPRQGKPAPFGQAAAFVFRPPHALEKSGDRTGGSQLADEINGADVNAQFQGRRGHEHL